MSRQQKKIIRLYILINLFYSAISTGCYDDDGAPRYCRPKFINAAENVWVSASNTCGVMKPTAYCNRDLGRRRCEICDVDNPHPSKFMTDFHDPNNITWWQSETMHEGIQYPYKVNITIDLGNTFEIAYISIRFRSHTPESFSIHRRKIGVDEWLPYQYYSKSCEDIYGLPDSNFLTTANQTRPLCTSDFSGLSPSTGAVVIFSTLEHRPEADDYRNVPELQEWVTAKDILISLDRLYTFGDEIYGEASVLKSYYYAISDISIGGSCHCNGHASVCNPQPLPGGSQIWECKCEHFTTGVDCEQCLPSHNDAEWQRATTNSVAECKECDCNGRSEICYFDKELWERTGRGGHCIECRDNTDGPHCEKCEENHYRRRDGRCTSCGCSPMGSTLQQCESDATCPCKSGVGGKRCNKCLPNYFNFSQQGCSPCQCYTPGTIRDSNCDQHTGRCNCKEYTEGHRCDRCKPGFFDLEDDNEFGCISCFCYGHSKECRSNRDYYQHIIETTFDRDEEGWTGEDYHGLRVPVYYDPDLQVLQLRSTNSHTMYYLAPARYLGDQRASYNQYLTFELRFGEEGARGSAEDVIIEGSGLKISIPITAQGNPSPEPRSSQKYKFRLHEHPSLGWHPRLRFHDFIRLLSNVTTIRIRGIYTPGSIAYLDNVRLNSAQQKRGNLEATWIELCTCPTGHGGQYCEKCADGYTRNPPGGTAFDRCVPCNCHGHGEKCDPDTGTCYCKHNTLGENCDRCAPGYYGTVRGSVIDCRPCPCPNQGPCVLLPGGQVACRECDIGHTGPSCELCVDGYYGDPQGRYGPPRPCRKCECNDNIDPNAVGNCNSTTGECLKCIYKTAGRNCEKCKPGHYGNPLAVPKRGCQPCNCYPPGTVQQTHGAVACDPSTGQCRCRANVVGLSCDTCEEHYWNIGSSRGCEKCSCHPIGSYNQTCDVRTGQCLCQSGVTGKYCDTCRPYYYGLSSEGCKPCNCDPVGSLSLQCDPDGQCQCRPNMQGRQCTQCRENKFPKGTMCLDCPACYNLVEEEIDNHRDKLDELSKLLEEIQKHPVDEDDFDFRRQLREAVNKLDDLLTKASKTAGQEASLIDDLNDLRNRIQEVQKTVGRIADKTEAVRPSNRHAERNISEAEDVIRQIEDAVKAAKKYLDTVGRKAIRDAIERSEKYGEQSERMSAIAKEARILADGHEDMAEEIKDLSDNALNVSSEAYRLARETIDSQDRMSGEVYALDKKLDDVEDLLRRTKLSSQAALKEGKEAYDDALDIYTDVHSLIVPDTNEREMKDEAAHIIGEAQRVQREADELDDLHKDTVDRLKKVQGDVEDILGAAVYQQQKTDGLLSDTDAALSKALDAVQLGEDTLEDAQKTLGTLKEFDKLVQESKGKAHDALKNVPLIKSLINEAEEKTKEAEDALGNAKQDAFDARDIAQQAQKIAEQASKNAKDVLDDAELAKTLKDKLKDQGEDLTSNVDDTEKRISEFDKEGKKNNQLAEDALHMAGESKNKALDATKKARNVLDELDDLLSQLGDLDGIDSSLLRELERRLAEAEKEMKDSDLDSKVDRLRDSKRKQEQWMRDYEAEIAMLEREVSNIAMIRQTLPEDCYRRVKLEP